MLISSLRIAKGIVFNALIVVYLAHYWLLFQDSWLPLGYPKKSKENPPFDPAVVSHTSNIPSSIGSSSTLSQEQCQLLICSLSSQMSQESIPASNNQQTEVHGSVFFYFHEHFFLFQFFIMDNWFWCYMSYHITFSLQHFFICSESFVNLPNGSKVPTTHVGRVILQHNLILHNV